MIMVMIMIIIIIVVIVLTVFEYFIFSLNAFQLRVVSPSRSFTTVSETVANNEHMVQYSVSTL